MTTYYVSNLGDDAADGSIGTPWKSVYHAGGIATSGDTINLISTATNPFRFDAPNLNMTNLGAGVTLTSETTAYMLHSIDLTHGATISLGLFNFDFESWADINTPDGWAVGGSGGTVVRASGDSQTYAIQFSEVGGQVSSAIEIYLNASTEYTIAFHTYSTVHINDLIFVLKNTGSGTRYLQSDLSTWSTSGSAIVTDIPAEDINKWIDTEKTFTSDIYRKAYTLELNGDGNSGTISYDYVTITPTTPQTYSWVNTAGDIYSLDINSMDAIGALAKCTTSDWSNTGVPALERISRDTTNPTTPTAGKWGFDSNVLYYTLVSGESINTIHFESIPTDSSGSAVYINDDNNPVVFNLYINGGSDCVSINGTSTGVSISDIVAQNPLGAPIIFKDSSSGTVSESTMTGSSISDGVTIINDASAIVERSDIFGNYDDGININSTGNLIASYNIIYDNSEKDATSSGIESQGSGDVSLYQNVMFENNTGWHNTSTGNCIVKNNIAMSNSNFNFHSTGVEGSLDADYNLSFDGSDDASFTDANILTVDPLFVNAAIANFRLKSGSPGIGTGAVIPGINDGGELGFYGFPADITPNRGAYQGPGEGIVSDVLGIQCKKLGITNRQVLGLGCGF